MLTKVHSIRVYQRTSRTVAHDVYDELLLPWLCPALSELSYQQARNASSTATSECSRPTLRKQRPSCACMSRRQIATAHDPTVSTSTQPFPLFPNAPLASKNDSRASKEPVSLSHLRKFQPDDLIILPTPANEPMQIFKTLRATGASGDMGQLQENISACFRVGSLDQGCELLRRMMVYLNPGAPQVVDLCREYMAKLLELIDQDAKKEFLAKMQKWFELDMRAKNVPIDSSALAIVLKACFLTLKGARLERKLRQYLKYAKDLGDEVQKDTISSELFSETEFAKLLRSIPKEYDKPPELIKETDLPDVTVRAQWNSGNQTNQRNHAPSLRSVEQKGLGLKALMRSLAPLGSEGDHLMNQERAQDDTLHERQIHMEQNVLSTALEKWREESATTQEMRQNGTLQNPLLGYYVHEWISLMVPLVEEEIKASEEAQHEEIYSDYLDRILLGPFLKMVSAEKMCAATVLAFLNSLSTLGMDIRHNFSNKAKMKLPFVVHRIGSLLEAEIQIDTVGEDFIRNLGNSKSPERRKKLLRLLKTNKDHGSQSSHFEGAQSSPSETQQTLKQAGFKLSLDLKMKLGALLFSVFLKVAKLPVSAFDRKTGKMVTSSQPVASHSWVWKAGKRHGVILTNDALLNKMKKEPVAYFIAKHLPMVCEPRDWKSLRDGPYLTYATEAIRLNDTNNSQREYLNIADQRGDLKQLYKGLDIIGKVPWRVNRPLFDIMAKVWNTGEQIAKLAPADPKLEYPPEPEQSDRHSHYRWMQIVKQIDDEHTGYHSQRCYQNFQLEVARAYLDFKFYCPHNIDFRGRAYPIPPYFNHMGADYVRGLFLFAEGKPLGEEGLDWLKIHLSNCYGVDKESLQDRKAFVDSRLEDIYDSVDHPIDGRRWWLTADDPWQTLAACIELKNALQAPEPSQFISHLPVQQDGSCNGLQHYAALGGDEIGAKQVNLAPGDKPADIYNAVAEKVKEEIQKDVSKGDKSAKLLHGKLTRKVVKQPVMTSVYGVTHYGAVAQVKKQLMEILPKPTLDNNINFEELSRYVASLIFKALTEMFNGAHLIQSWLGECGARISQAVTPEQMERVKIRRERAQSKSAKPVGGSEPGMQYVSAQKKIARVEDYQFKSTIVWTTPLGMPVVQPYRQSQKTVIKTNIQQINLRKHSLSDPVKKDKQLAAFPPNFIHSLDATHMMLSAIKCNEMGLTFAAVHDSFWTHAGDVPLMNRILRDAFVRMHSEDVVGRLYEEFSARYAGCLRWAAVQLDSPLGQRIHNLLRSKRLPKSSYTSVGVRHKEQVDLLMEEYERIRLLHSDDPQDVERGRNLITPASIHESARDANEVEISEATNTFKSHFQETGSLLAEENEDEVDIISDPDEARAIDDMTNDLETTMSVEEAKTDKTKSKKRESKKSEFIHFWMPLTFPAPPQRGRFDVKKLQSSQYFFS